MSYNLNLRFRTPGIEASSIEFHLRQLQRWLQALAIRDPLLKDTEWLIATGTRNSSYLYNVFDSSGPTSAALAIFREDFKKSDALKSVTLWNGQEERAKAASIGSFFDRKDGASNWIQLSIRSAQGISRLGGWESTADALKAAATIYTPIYSSLETPNYDPVFKDRPGVGWMLYLPRMLTVQQVPEARALVPAMSEDGKKQIGTIIVSVTDEPFSDENPEHVKIANAIEIRLVDQDLLPRYADL